jgi:acyl-CoA synthetase (AMP-forming)/AMP-acid ligase II
VAQTVYGDDQRFVSTYWANFAHEQLYSTFDWGIKDEDGYYFILGRTDDVINVAGHRLVREKSKRVFPVIRRFLKLLWSASKINSKGRLLSPSRH